MGVLCRTPGLVGDLQQVSHGGNAWRRLDQGISCPTEQYNVQKHSYHLPFHSKSSCFNLVGFFPIQKTEPSPSTQISSLLQPGFQRSGRCSHLGQQSHLWPLPSAWCSVPCLVCLRCFPVSSLGLLTAPFSLDKTLRSICKPFLRRGAQAPSAVCFCCSPPVRYLPYSCITPRCFCREMPRVISKAKVLSSHAVCFMTVQSCKALTFG